MAAPLGRTCVGRVINRSYFILSPAECQSVLTTTYRYKSQNKAEDFFGIAEDQRFNNVEETQPLRSAEGEDHQDERNMLLRPQIKNRKSKELVIPTFYGQVRIDKKARDPSFYGTDATGILQSVALAGRPDEVFGNLKWLNNQDFKESKTRSRRRRVRKTSANYSDKTDERVSENFQSEYNYYDEQYFQSVRLSEPSRSGTIEHKQKHRIAPFTDRNFEEGTETLKPKFKPRSVQETATEGSINVQNASDNFIDETYFPTLTQSAESSPKTAGEEILHTDQNQNDFIDSQYFPQHFKQEHSSFPEQHDTEPTLQQPRDKASNFEDDANFVDAQYFVAASKEKCDDAGMDNTQVLGNNFVGDRALEPERDKFSFIDGQYFGNHSSQSSVSTSFEGTVSQYSIAGQELPAQPPQIHPVDTDRNGQLENRFEREPDFAQDLSQFQDIQEGLNAHFMKETKQSMTSVKPKEGESFRNKRESSVMEKHSSQDKFQESSAEAEESRHQTKTTKRDAINANKIKDSAYDAAIKMRKNLRQNLSSNAAAASEELPSDKQRVLAFKEQVPDLHHMTAAEVARLLADNIIFENDDFIAVDKPYGLPSHGGPGVRLSVGQLLEPLCHRLDKGRQQLNTLHLVHRLDKETTGAMLLAKNAEVAWQLLGMFRRREVAKTYWALTKGLPQPHEGIIDIPLARHNVRGVYKTVVKPKEYVHHGHIKTQKWSRRGDHSHEAVTEYRVLGDKDNMALVECRPLTGVQHQIRVHLAQALNTPILGDHKYSHMDRLAPQKLAPEALHKLGIRQAQVRYVPMHLHAKALVLPEWRGRTNVFISGRVPKFFLKNMKNLKIKLPSR